MLEAKPIQGTNKFVASLSQGRGMPEQMGHETVVTPDAGPDLLATTRRINKRFDMPGFRPNEHYVREMQRFEILPRDLKPENSLNVYKTEQAYWRSFWFAAPTPHQSLPEN